MVAMGRNEGKGQPPTFAEAVKAKRPALWREVVTVLSLCEVAGKRFQKVNLDNPETIAVYVAALDKARIPDGAVERARDAILLEATEFPGIETVATFALAEVEKALARKKEIETISALGTDPVSGEEIAVPAYWLDDRGAILPREKRPQMLDDFELACIASRRDDRPPSIAELWAAYRGGALGGARQSIEAGRDGDMRPVREKVENARYDR